MWNKTCENIFARFVKKLNSEDIRYFVLRNYEDLPEANSSKDVDIIIEPGFLKRCRRILLDTYREEGMDHYYEVQFGHVHCFHGMDTEHQMGIHIDLIDGYFAKGYEVYRFQELYDHVKEYNGFYALDDYMNGVMLLVYKQFGYRQPILKEKYRKEIRNTYEKYPRELEEEITRISNKKIAEEIIEKIKENDFDGVLALNKKFTRSLRGYVIRKKPFKTLFYSIQFFCQKVWRVVIAYRKYKRVIAIVAPDGSGKTTFINELKKKMDDYYVADDNDERFHLYHFRPEIFSNLGEVGEKMGVMEQNKDFTTPHRSEAANPVSSFFRISYYTLDYLIGWQKCIRKDVHYDKYSIFDRYSYDFIVDPVRSKLNLPRWMRRFFVRLTPQPTIVFVLCARPEVIYERKQELDLEEIRRQMKEYSELADKRKNFYKLNAEQSADKIADEAIDIILDKYTKQWSKK